MAPAKPAGRALDRGMTITSPSANTRLEGPRKIAGLNRGHDPVGNLDRFRTLHIEAAGRIAFHSRNAGTAFRQERGSGREFDGVRLVN